MSKRGRPRKNESPAFALRQLRLDAHCNQPDAQRRIEEALGHHLGSGTLSKWESGVIFPSTDYIPAIAAAYRTSLEAVFFAIKQDKDAILDARECEHASPEMGTR
jgi:transcriptional regulator with XRE-family HTH domain